ncbi:MAG: EVE domain-containing protein [Planctomycetota bacterium]
MKHWLIKTEPGTWSWADQTSAKAQTTEWDGVRNHQAGAHLKAMAVGDRCFFYHSVSEKSVVGVVEVVKTWEPDPTDQTGRGFGMVTVKAVGPMPTPVTLADIKARNSLADMVLVNNSRLSVQPVTATQWKAVCKMGDWKD